MALSDGNMVAVKALLRAGYNINNPWDDYFVFACCDLDGRFMKLLIEHGYDVNIDSELEGTALHGVASKAVAVNDTTCLELFMKAGAKERSVVGNTLVSEEELTPTQYIKKDCEGDDAKAGALNRALHVLANVRSGDKETPRVQLKKENEQLKKENKRLRKELGRTWIVSSVR